MSPPSVQPSVNLCSILKLTMSASSIDSVVPMAFGSVSSLSWFGSGQTAAMLRATGIQDERRDDRVGELRILQRLAGPRCRALCAGAAAATVRIEYTDRCTVDRRRGEITCSLTGGRPELLGVPKPPHAIALRSRPEKGVVPPERPTTASAVDLVHCPGQPDVLLCHFSLHVEEVKRLSPHRSGLKEPGAMEGVGARTRSRVEHAAARAAHLGVVRMHLNPDVLYRLDRRTQQ